MANTRETLGDQATLDGLVNNSLTSFEESGVTSLRSYALNKHTALTSVKFPNVTTGGSYSLQYCTGLQHIASADFPNLSSIGQYMFAYCSNLEDAVFPSANGASNTYAFRDCTKLEMVDFAKASGTGTIAANTFNGCSKLKHLILRSSSKATLSNVSAFTGTPISSKNGAIYVPASLISSYKSDSKWGNYFIFDVADYPKTDYSTISDSWATITSNANYATDYAVGDTKSFTSGGTTFLAEIVGFNKDTKTGGGAAGISWLSYPITENYQMNSSATTSGGWSSSKMRTHLSTDILPNLSIKDYIVEVSKISDTYESGAIVHNGQTTNDKLWIPSAYEIFGGSSYETQGCTYSDYLNSATKRTKYYTGSANIWWLRSASSSYAFWYVRYGGGASSNNANDSGGVVLGFCTN